jgi:ubiquitin-protein ligase
VDPAGGAAPRALPYQGGMFRVSLAFPDDFPAQPPSEVKFLTRIWHPQVELPSGKPCLEAVLRDWRPTQGVRDVLVILRELIAAPAKDGGVNADAAAEMERSLDEFERHAREETRKWATG